MDSQPAISVNNLSKKFSNEAVLHDISFDVEDGELCVIMGPSGSGKSTLLQCIAGLVDHEAGTIEFDSKSATELSVEERNMGYVFQEFEDTLFPHKSVRKNVAFGLEQQSTEYSKTEIEEQIDEILELLAIPDTKQSLPTELSGGQQQRVELARQLVRECELMLLDDPLADLDYKLQKRMEIEIRQIHKEMGSTFVYVTHSQDQALKLADKLVILNHGRIEQVGAPEDVYNEPASAFVGQFVGDSNPLVGTATVDGDRATVETNIGTMTARLKGGRPQDGRQSLTIVRPEDVDFAEEATGKENFFEAELIDWTYMGEKTEYVFGIEGIDYPLQSVQKGTPAMAEADIGSNVPVGWDEEDTLCFGTVSSTPTDTVTSIMEV